MSNYDYSTRTQRASRQYDEERRYDDEYGDYQEPRTTTSVRRYRPQEQPTTRSGSTTQRSVPQRSSAQPAPRTRPVQHTQSYAPQPVPVTIEHVKDRTGRQHMIVSPREERYTDDDDQIRPLQVTHKGGRRISRRAFGRIVLLTGVAAFGAWGGMEYGVSHSTTTNGNPVYIECGHDDDASHKTQLRAYVDPEADRAIFLEIPGGNYKLAVATLFPTFQSLGYTGSLDQVDILLQPQKIGPKRYEIVVTLTCRDVGILQQPVVEHFMLSNDPKTNRFILD